MKSISWPAGVLSLLVAVGSAAAQYGGLKLDYRRSSKNATLSLAIRKPYGYYAGPFGPLAPYGVVRSHTQVIIVSPPIILTPRPLLPLLPLGPPLEDIDAEPPPLPRLRVEPPDEAPLPGRDAGVFRPLEADNRDKALRPVAPPKRDIPPEERLLPPPLLKPNPADETLRQLELGKEAFARGEYGRAAERFRQAADLAPTNPLAHLLLGQAHLALGNYRRAFDALQIGLRLDPTWPKQPFLANQLYGDNVVDHAEHLRILEEVLALNPDDPVLLFVTGYQLWFDGRRDEARPLLLRAAPVLPDPNVVDHFLQALPNREVL